MLRVRPVFICSLLFVLPLVITTRCNSCGDRCEECEYGYVYSKTCEFNVCYKAPGEPCGYVDINDRICAEGLYCKNNKCQGCALSTFKCYVDLQPSVKKNVNAERY